MQVTNTNPSPSATFPYASVTLVIDESSYYVFGASVDVPISPNGNQLWGTLASSRHTPNVIDSNNFDVVFANASSFTTTKILLNSYKQGTGINNPDHQISIPNGAYTFNAGHSYNILVNPANGASEIN